MFDDLWSSYKIEISYIFILISKLSILGQPDVNQIINPATTSML